MWAQAISIGSQLLGGLLQSGAAESAKDAQVHSQMQARQDLARATAAARGVQDPYLQSGYAAQNAITGRLGLPTQGVQSAINQAGADYSAYVAANPDLVTAAQAAVGRGEFASIEDFGRFHYDTFGKAEGRQLPGTSGAIPNRTDPAAQTMDAPGGMNALTGQPSGGTYGTTQNPTWEAPSYQAPDPFSFDIESFKDNPAYQFALEQGTGQILASSAATGALQSGAALKALQDRGQKTAYQFYAPERDFAYGQYQDQRNFGRGVFENDRNFGRGVYESDRNYLTDRYDRTTDDLFRVSEQGRGSAGIVTNALLGQGTANANSQIATGDSRAGNALTRGDIWSGVLGGVAGGISGMLSGRGGQNSLYGLY